MSVVISFANMKGGVGKTTLCINVGFQLFIEGRRVLVVDNDPQFNATISLLSPQTYIEKCIKGDQQTIYNIYEKPPRIRGTKREKADPKNFFWTRWYLRNNRSVVFDLIPSRIELYETLRNPSQKEYLLDKFLARHAQRYDFVLIDCPPTPSVLNLSAFAASDYVIIPVTPDYYATLGLPQFLGTLNDFKEDLHDAHDIRPLGLVFNNVDRRGSVDAHRSMEIVDKTLSDLGAPIPIFQSTVSHLKVFQKTLWQSVPVQIVSGRGTRGKGMARLELRSLTNEIEEKIEEVTKTKETKREK